ncbi:hypothetical protein ACF3M2_05760 [Tissierella carlieri]|jgi:hypothetical protein|uniref:hypothetical protein n=1 Tax=Tissierella carlieri TaxID=689904 RepID=UPI0028054AC1|nr:hypothetical protein [uncultured Tissierella sp.]MDU5080940.1 hypothetical protein [Bacillota bacterium]
MKDINWLKENYLNFLKEKQENFKSSIEDLQKQECLDEVNLEKVKLNIAEIFYKMFNISLNDKSVDLEEKYLGFFDKITKPWYINKEKALKFGDEKEVIIEDIKIQEAEELKSRFKEYYNEIIID